MRLGEFYAILSRNLNSEDYLKLESTSLYAGQAYSIGSVDSLFSAISTLNDFNIRAEGYEVIQNILSTLQKNGSQTISVDEYNLLVNYINQLNPKIPLLISILSNINPPQPPQVINIKLPENIYKLEELTELNKRFSKIFSIFSSIHGDEVKFIGFDKGTEWYVVLAEGIGTFVDIVGCIDIAIRVINFFKTLSTERAKKDFSAGLGNNSEYTEEKFNTWLNKRETMEVESEVKSMAIKTSNDGGRTNAEILTNLVKATTLLITEIKDNNVEFHLSLNPPEYVDTNLSGAFSINYENLKSILPQEQQKDTVKELGQSVRKKSRKKKAI